jgi:UDP-glucuronate decarboxylase
MKIAKAPVALVAGGAGFIGTHICGELIKAGFRVICIDNFQTGMRSNLAKIINHSSFELIEIDLAEPLPKKFWKLEPDLIFNLACAASPPHYQARPEHTLLTSILGMRALLQMAEQAHARIGFSSTSEVYGDPQMHPQREDYWGHVNPTGPRACYDEGKRAAETLCFDYLRAGRADVRVARIFNTYGPHMRVDDGRVVSNVINQALSGEDITIYGDGQQTRSFCYVSDLVEGLLRLARHSRPVEEPVNLGNPRELTVRELVEKVVWLTNSPSRLVTRPLPVDDPQRRRPDIARAKAVLAWQPRVALEDGLTATIAWYRSQAQMQDLRSAKVTSPIAAPQSAR